MNITTRDVRPYALAMMEKWATTCAPSSSARRTGPQGRIQITPGSRFMRGTSFMGMELAKLLDDYTRTHLTPPAGGQPSH